ncbi:MAG: sugar ABC transporter substrate-binding protein [Treponema sp.]|jgi:ABC-type glycerol-3-phosphate transport system substrate-binding protein|nr:sugar ABC transporter substrate-binding protein [Treponema sp.]
MKKNAILLIPLLLLPLFMAFGGGQGQQSGGDEYSREFFKGTSKTTVKLALPGNDFDQKKFGSVIQEYVNETGNSVEIIYVVSSGGWGGYFQKLQGMIAAGDSPDLFRVAIEGFQIFYTRGLVDPIDPFFDKYPAQRAILQDQHPRLLAPFRVDGKLYGLAFDWNNVVAHVNLNILKEAGLPLPPQNWNYATFLDYAQKMTYTRPDGTRVYGTAVPDSYFIGSCWLFNNGASILNGDWTKAAINSPEAVEVFQFAQDLIYKYEVSPRPPVDSNQLFINDQIGIQYAGRWLLRGYEDSKFSAVDIVPLPTNKTPVAIFGSGIFPILKSSKNKDAAFLLACKLASAKSQGTIIDNSGISSSIEIMDRMVKNDTFPKNTILYRQAADIARAVESPPDYADIQAAFDRAISKIYANEASAKDALDACAKEIDDILALSR